jgi:hypothetical protein
MISRISLALVLAGAAGACKGALEVDRPPLIT